MKKREMFYAGVVFNVNQETQYDCNGNPKAKKDTVYSYKSLFPVKEGDIVVVETRDSLQIAAVKAVAEDASSPLIANASNFILAVVDCSTVNKYYEEQKMKTVLEAKLNKKLAAMDKMERYKYLIKTDPEAAELVKKLEELAE